MADELYQIFMTLLPFSVTGLLSFLVTYYTVRSRKSLDESEEAENYASALLKQGQYAAALLEPLGLRVKELDVKMVDLETLIETCRGEKDDFLEEVTELKEMITALQEENARLSGRIEELEKENNELHKVNSVLRERIRGLEHSEKENEDGRDPE